ncbi:MAG: hypothetical protein KBF43_12655 [Dermatophilaceae bacterium]|jgi:hypothetical protein|nr:hypothetical protein [Acidimicrobiia bacterium]MBP8882422.1 hypothetical protein [Dermatophilaceae bacterium]MBP9919431.1 hypothetical protein [Dermatophilaceae bacterium]
MRLVIANGIQYDADNLPAHVNAEDCVPAEQWFADNAVGRVPAEVVEPVITPTPVSRNRKRRA